MFNNFTQYWLMKGYYPKGICSLQAGIDQSQHHSTSLNAPERLLRRYSYATNDLPIDSVPGATPRGDTPEK